jgi:serpin B
MKTSHIALLLSVASLTACSTTSSDDDPEVHVETVRSSLARDTAPVLSPTELTTLATDEADFAVDLYRAVGSSAEFAGKDVFLSPHSISTALAMTYAGANGETKAEMKKALHFGLPDDRLHRGFDYLDLALASRGKGALDKDGKPFRLSIVNAVWGQKSYAFEAPFLDTVAVNYGAGLNVLDFEKAPEEARGTINRWVEQKTESRIKDLLPERTINTLTRMVLVNAVYFNAAWATKFEPEASSPAPFTTLQGAEKPVTMMRAVMSAAHTQDAAFDAIELPYDGGEASMLVIAPTKGTFAAFESSLTGAKVLDVLAGLREKPVQLSLPKSKLNVATDLMAPLKSLGMKAAFYDGADFTGIAHDDLAISGVFHQTFLQVDEGGTEAAAATAVVVSKASSAGNPIEYVNMTVDRPYVVAIVDRQTKTLLFLGRILEPK